MAGRITARAGRRRWALTGITLAGTILAGLAIPAVAAPPRDIPIEGSRIYPESITSDAAGNLYVGSNSGTIYRALKGAATATPWIVPGPDNGLKSLFGVYADDARHLLWTCSNPNLFSRPPAPGVSELKAFDLTSGKLKASYPFPEGKPTACNDIAVAPDGTTWASETMSGRIFVLRPGATALELWVESADLVGIDGITVGGDGKLYINNVRKQLFQRVEAKADGSFDRLVTLTPSQVLNGPDGLRALGGNRFLQAEGPGGRVGIWTVEGDTATLAPVIASGLDGSVGVTRSGDTVYVVEGKIGYMFDPALKDKSPDPFIIRAFPLPVAN